MARLLRVNVASYDYTGYGRSSGEPSASATLADIAAVLDHLKHEHGLREEDVILYGQSGMRVLNPGWSKWPSFLDIFPNHKLVPRIRSRLLVVHGTSDEVIDVAHGRQLHSLAATAAEPLWLPGYNHQNVETAAEYIPRLRHFFAECWGDAYRQQLAAAGIKL
eukprot:scaffold11.g3849.t1